MRRLLKIEIMTNSLRTSYLCLEFGIFLDQNVYENNFKLQGRKNIFTRFEYRPFSTYIGSRLYVIVKVLIFFLLRKFEYMAYIQIQ